MPIICSYCKSEFYDKGNLNKHQRTSKYCIKIQLEKDPNSAVNHETYDCEYCNKKLTTKKSLKIHLETCKTKVKNEKHEENELKLIKEEMKKIKDDMVMVKLKEKPSSTENCFMNDTTIDIFRKHYSKIDNILDIINVDEYKDGIIRVTLCKTKNAEKVDIYEEQIKNLTTELETTKEELQALSVKHVSSMKTHRYIKFKDTDPCFYIIESGVACNDCGNSNLQYKFGIAGTDQYNTIDERLQSHRTLWPLLKVKYLLFMKDIMLIEKNFKMMFEKEINPNGHEIINGVPLEDIIERVKKLFDILCIEKYHITPEEKLKKYNDYVDTTLKPVE